MLTVLCYDVGTTAQSSAGSLVSHCYLWRWHLALQNRGFFFCENALKMRKFGTADRKKNRNNDMLIFVMLLQQSVEWDNLKTMAPCLMTSKVLLNISKQQELGNGAKCRESSPKKSIFRVSRQFGNGTAQIIQAEFKNYSFFFCIIYWRAPQQKLQTHRSLKAYCATLLWRRWWRFSCFSI